jgi:phosphoribosyl 1,2-cyclic phosphodiesterase
LDVELIFLGTGGGRFVTITQKRWTGGIRITAGKLHMHLDPGPGALVHSIGLGLNPQRLGAVLVSHSHPDHYTDAEVMVEAMTAGMLKKRGVLVGTHSVLVGNEVCGPAISNYHKRMPKEVIETRPGQTFKIESINVSTVMARHTDPDTVGFKFALPEVGDIGYTSDTELFEGINRLYQGTRVLILCTMRPRGMPWKGHMSTEDAVQILSEVKPEVAILTHFGAKMIFAGPQVEAKFVEQQTGIPVIAAIDGMRVRVGKKIHFLTAKGEQKGLAEFLR